MHYIEVKIVRFVEETQPGVVECELVDACGCRHTLVDKVPIFTDKMLWWDSAYPQPGVAQCDVLARLEDDGGRKLVRVGLPYIRETSTENAEFVLHESQIWESSDWPKHR